MYDIRHRVGIAVPRAQVYATISTLEGVGRFWTTEAEGSSEAGGRLQILAGGPTPAAVMEIVELSPDVKVRWLCVDGPAEWIGTELTFDLADTDGETVLLFTHAGWTDPGAFMHHCSTKWASILLGLRSGLEGGSYSSYPNDARISSSWR